MTFWQKNRTWLKLTALITAAVIGMLPMSSVLADTRSDLENAKALRSAAEEEINSARSQMESARAAKSAAEESLSEATSRINALESEKAALQTYLESLNTELAGLSESLTQLSGQISDKHVEIEMAKAAIVRAEYDEAAQYSDMQLRIKYMYENGTTGFLASLCEADDFSDFLNRADEISQIQEFDRQLLDDYKAACETVRHKKADLEVEQKNLEDLKAEAEAKQAEVQSLAESTDSEIARYVASIGEEEIKASSLMQQIEAQKANLAALEEQAARAEAERKRADEEATKAAALIAQQEEAERLAKEAAAKAAAEEAARLNASTPSPAQEETSGAPSTGRYLGNFIATAYCPCAQCCGRPGAPTASGVQPRVNHTVAMGGIPFGTKLLINGVVYTVEDRGTPYGHVDIFMGSHSECLRFGLRRVDVYLVE